MSAIGTNAVLTPESFVMVFDVESIGLHGQAWAVAWSLGKIGDTETIEEGIVWCPPEMARGSDEDRRWIAENCDPQNWVGFQMQGSRAIKATLKGPREVRDAFWDAWVRAGGPKACMAAADCAWPVEARFLSECVDDDEPRRRWQGPYPLIDITTIRVAVSKPLFTTRLPDERPAHNPLADVRHSLRVLRENVLA